MKRKGMGSISKIAALFMAMTLLAGCANNGQAMEVIAGTDNGQTGNTTVLFYVTDEGLYAYNLSTGHKKQLHASPDISSKMYPLSVSPDGNHIAYTAGDELYVTSTGSGEISQPVCVLSPSQAEDNPIVPWIGSDINYAWADNDRLLFAKDDIIGLYNVRESGKVGQSGMSVKASGLIVDAGFPLIAGDFRYENLTSGKDGVVYAKREAMPKDEGVEYNGRGVTEIVQLNIDALFAENGNPGEQSIRVLLTGSPLRPDTGDLGETFTIAGISPDKTKLFIWPHYCSASISADGTGEVLIYDLLAADGVKSQNPAKSVTVVKVEEGILMYPDNIAASLADSSKIALNTGGGREMWTYKQTQVLDIQNNSLMPVDFGCEVTMTPAYSPDGAFLACSGGKDGRALYNHFITETEEKGLEEFHLVQIMGKSIYLFNTETKESKRLTSMEYVCDFAPTFINDGSEIVFASWEGEQKNLSLNSVWWEGFSPDENGGDFITGHKILAEGIKYPEPAGSLFGFYGHIDSKPYFTIWQSRGY